MAKRYYRVEYRHAHRLGYNPWYLHSYHHKSFEEALAEALTCALEDRAYAVQVAVVTICKGEPQQRKIIHGSV